jgi:uncharacterized phage protein gp47/JayE
MAYFKPHIAATGLHLPTYQDVLDHLNERSRAIFGNDIYLETDSQDYQANAEVADLWADIADAVQQSYNNRSIKDALGVAVDGLMKINGLKRLDASKSICGVTLTGTPGTRIAGGLISDSLGEIIWAIEDCEIPDSGFINVTATCQSDGDTYADAGTLNKIVTQTQGWVSVTNPSNAIPGKSVESDPAAKARQSISTARPSKTVLEGIMGGIAEIPNVLRSKVYENDAGIFGFYGVPIPEHSICAIVEGGDAQEIGREIYLRKTPGCDTYGDVEVKVVDIDPTLGVPPPMKFYRPSYVDVFVKVNIKERAGYVDTLADEIKQAVSGFINSLDIGEDVSVSLLETIAQSVAPNLRTPAFTLSATLPILIGASVGDLQEGDINIAFNEAARCAPDNVEVEPIV